MVVPILAKTELLAELDIESYFTNTFAKADQAFGEEVAQLVGKYMEKKR